MIPLAWQPKSTIGKRVLRSAIRSLPRLVIRNWRISLPGRRPPRIFCWSNLIRMKFKWADEMNSFGLCVKEARSPDKITVESLKAYWLEIETSSILQDSINFPEDGPASQPWHNDHISFSTVIRARPIKLSVVTVLRILIPPRGRSICALHPTKLHPAQNISKWFWSHL
jgi:hypothetical protein